MCPICWISGFIAILFGGSFIATINHPISWIVGILLIAFSFYKFYEAKKRGKKMTEETKKRNRKTIFRFIQGVIVGSLVTIIIFYSLTYKEHEHEHEQMKPGSAIIEEDKYQRLIKEVPSITIFYNPSDREHKKLHKWFKRHNIHHIHQKNKMIFD